MSNANVETVQRIYEAFGQGDVQTIVDQLADDVDFASEADQKIAPWHGRHGKAEVPQFFQALGETIDVTEFTPLSFTSNDTDVMAVIRFGLKVKATGKAGTMDLHHWWRFRDGKVVLYRGTEDTALTADLLAP
jgi:ketosteroid isomerase-like protein